MKDIVKLKVFTEDIKIAKKKTNILGVKYVWKENDAEKKKKTR